MDHTEKRRQVFQFTEPGAPQPAPQFASPIGVHLQPGTMIDSRYQIESIIGQGGCGCVYKVKQVVMKKHFALKTLNPVGVSKLTMLRLQKEAEAASKLDHENLVRATDFGLINETQPYLVMEYVDGPTLAEHLKRRGKISVDEALAIFIPLCSGLAYAHKEGVVHRDIKPSNIILAYADTRLGFTPKVVDFGIAKMQFAGEGAASLTATGDVFGTPLYMSPEQCLGSSVDQRSDIYSLGCMLFEALTGAPPFAGTAPLELMMQHSTIPPPTLRDGSLGQQFPEALESIVAMMLVKVPNDRYQNLTDTAKDLSQLQHGGSVTLSTRARQQGESKTQKKAMQSVIALMVLLAVGTGGYMLGSPRNLFGQTKEYQTSFIRSFFESGYFSNTSTNMWRFRFPKGITLGSIYWWNKGKKIRFDTTKNFEVPAGSKLILIAKGPLVSEPYFWGFFRDTDFAGIKVDFVESTQLVNGDQILTPNLYEVLSREKLRLLALTSPRFDDRTWGMLSTLPNLHWLWLNGAYLDEKRISGSDIANLKNVGSLKVLSVDGLTEPSALLNRLAQNSSLVRLSLGNVKLEKDAGKDLAALRNLKVLRIRSSKIIDPQFFQELAHSPQLEKLCIHDSRTDEMAAARELSKMRNLRELDLDWNDKSPAYEKLALLSHCKVTHLGQQKLDLQGSLMQQGSKLFKGLDKALGLNPEGNNAAKSETVNWFDFLSEDPEGLW